MKTSVIGFPRIGTQRELKFETEKYFKGTATKEQLDATSAALRKKHWIIQKQSGLDFIPSNDFSFYDGILDTAVALNIIPSRYRSLNLDKSGTYFAGVPA